MNRFYEFTNKLLKRFSCSRRPPALPSFRVPNVLSTLESKFAFVVQSRNCLLILVMYLIFQQQQPSSIPISPNPPSNSPPLSTVRLPLSVYLSPHPHAAIAPGTNSIERQKSFSAIIMWMAWI